jgi:hypothetical protein
MPRLANLGKDDTTITLPNGSIQFSAVRPEVLAEHADEYTLVTIVVDTSYSVSNFANELLEMLKAVIKACEKSPRAENLLVRLVTFNDDWSEVHGFKLLNEIDADAYPALRCDGCTALFDSSYAAIDSANTYGKTLNDQDFTVNSVVVILTDGEDNRSTFGPSKVLDAVNRIKKEECLESQNIVLIGVNTDDGDCKDALEDFQRESGITQYVDIPNATPQMLAKLAGFVSQSISSQSQALGTGGASQSLTF